MSGLSILWKTLLTFSTAWVIPAALKPLIIRSLRLYRYLYISKIHLACNVLTWDKFNETSTSAVSFTSLSCLVTCSVCHMLYFSLMKLFAGLLKVISSGCHLLVRLWGTMTRTQLFSRHSLATSSLSCPLIVSIITRLICSIG